MTAPPRSSGGDVEDISKVPPAMSTLTSPTKSPMSSRNAQPPTTAQRTGPDPLSSSPMSSLPSSSSSSSPSSPPSSPSPSSPLQPPPRPRSLKRSPSNKRKASAISGSGYIQNDDDSDESDDEDFVGSSGDDSGGSGIDSSDDEEDDDKENKDSRSSDIELIEKPKPGLQGRKQNATATARSSTGVKQKLTAKSKQNQNQNQDEKDNKNKDKRHKQKQTEDRKQEQSMKQIPAALMMGQKKRTIIHISGSSLPSSSSSSHFTPTLTSTTTAAAEKSEEQPKKKKSKTREIVIDVEGESTKTAESPSTGTITITSTSDPAGVEKKRKSTPRTKKTSTSEGKGKAGKQGDGAASGGPVVDASAGAGTSTRKAGGPNIVKGKLITLNKKKKLLILQQDAYPLDKYTPYVSLTASFHEWFLDQPSGLQITDIAQEYHPLIVMIGHESALESEEDLARFVKKEMKPADVDEAGMFMGKEAESDDGKLQEESQSADIDLNAIIKLIPDLFQKRSYGFHADDFSRFSASHEPESSSSSPANSLEIPTTLQLNRWEAREMKLIPQKEGSSRVLKARDLMEQRKKVRNEAREEAKALVKQLSVEDVDAMLGVKLQNGQEGDTGGPMEIDELPIVVASSPAPMPASDAISIDPTSPDADKRASKKVKKAKEETEDQKQRRLVKEVKDQKKADEEAKHAKQSKMLMGFFSKVKPAPTTAAAPVPSVPTSSSIGVARGCSVMSVEETPPPAPAPQSDYQTTFWPFSLAKHVELAPINSFRRDGEKLQRSQRAEGGMDVEVPLERTALLKDFLDTVLIDRKFPRPSKFFANQQAGGSSSSSSIRYKTTPLYHSVSHLLHLAQEADDPRSVIRDLKDSRKYPNKVFKFAEDLRPPYQGTWSKPSLLVGPRTPFANDPLIDYSVDEGTDWAEEYLEEDVNSGNEDEESGDEDEDDDVDSWLADDDEIEMMDGVSSPAMHSELYPFDEDFLPPPAAAPVPPTSSKPATAAKKQPHDKTSRITALVPFQKGPCWEDKLGEVTWPVFDGYRICLLNDTPTTGIDPFSWHAEDGKSASIKVNGGVSANHPATHAQASINLNPNLKTGTGVLASIFPPNPSSASTSVPAPASSEAATSCNPNGRPKNPPKIAIFPPSYLGSFLQVIHESTLNTGQLLRDLNTRFKGVTTQAAIKAKLDEVSERAGARSGLWMVKDEAWIEAGCPKPSPTITPPTTMTTAATTTATSTTTPSTAVDVKQPSSPQDV